MQTSPNQPAQPQAAAIELQADGLTVRLSFSAVCPEFSPPSFVGPQAGFTPPADQLASGPAVVNMAAASAGMLLQAFAEESSIVQLSWALQAEDKLRVLRKADATGGAA